MSMAVCRGYFTAKTSQLTDGERGIAERVVSDYTN
jgi:hypothetical protein